MTELDNQQSTSLFREFTAVVLERLAKNKPVRRALPSQGRLRIDRQLPFLIVYRVPESFDDGTRDLVTSEAAYLIAPGDPGEHDSIEALCQQLAGLLNEHFGTFLIVEVWSKAELGEGKPRLQPVFEIVTSEPDSLHDTLEAFSAALSEVTVAGHHSIVTVRETTSIAPPALPVIDLASVSQGKSVNSVVLGLPVAKSMIMPHQYTVAHSARGEFLTGLGQIKSTRDAFETALVISSQVF